VFATWILETVALRGVGLGGGRGLAIDFLVDALKFVARISGLAVIYLSNHLISYTASKLTGP
jgi:hypothetical protein